MKRIILEAVSPSEMRPPYRDEVESGDWLFNEGGDLIIRVIGKDFDNHNTFLFALHEMVEAKLCRTHGVTQEAVDRFDAAYAAMIDHDPDAEPGDHPAAPYRREHRHAMLLEHMMANFLGLDGYGEVR